MPNILLLPIKNKKIKDQKTMLRFISDSQSIRSVTRRPWVASMLIGVLFFGTAAPSFATVNFSSTLPMAGNAINPTYDFEKSFYINYPAGSKIQSILESKNITVAFTDDSANDPALKTFMQQINTDIVTNEHSAAVLTDLQVAYQLIISGYPDHASIDYKIVLTPTVESYVLNKASGDIPQTFDASWMAFNANTPVTINTSQYGPVEINYPIDIIQSQVPDLYNALKGTDAYNIFAKPSLMDATGLFSQQPVNKWDSLFDPAYTLTETAGYGYKGQKIAVTTFSSGLSNAFSGTLHINNIDQDFTGPDGVKYHISTKEQANSGTVNVEGHANANQVKGGWTFVSTVQASTTTSTTTAGGTSVMMVYGMAGFAGVVAVVIFIWSNKKMKAVIHEVDTGPIVYETRQHWADKFDGEPSPASSADEPSSPDDKPKRSAI